MGHWVGANGEWIAFAQRPGRWYLQNVYTMVQVELPPVQRVEIDQYEAEWYPCPPFTYYYQHARIELLNIDIAKKSSKFGEQWHYNAIAVFDKFIATIECPYQKDWTILRNDYLAPATYVDAFSITNSLEGMSRIYAVTEPRGDVLVWEPSKWSKSII